MKVILLKKKKLIKFESNFNQKRIESLFSNLSSLSFLKLINLRKNYKLLNYSTVDIDIEIYKIATYPLMLVLMTVLSSIIMFNFRRDKSLVFHIILGILMSVIIYYINFMFSSLGNNGKIPIFLSIFLPILFISIFAFIGLIRVNEK